MTDEELEKLIQEKTEEIDGLPDGSDTPLTRKERSQRLVLRLQKEALEKMKQARERNNVFQEIRASMDYSILVKYGGKHPFWIGFLKAQAGWWGF